MKKYLINLTLILKLTACLIFNSYSQSLKEIELTHKQEIQHIRSEYEKMRFQYNESYKITVDKYGKNKNFIIKSLEEQLSEIFTYDLVKQAFSLKHLDIKLQHGEIKEINQFVLFTFNKHNPDSTHFYIDFYQDGYLVERYNFVTQYHYFPDGFEYQEGRVTKLTNGEIVAEGTCLFTINKNDKDELIYSFKLNEWECKIFTIGKKDFYEAYKQDDE